MNTNKYKYTEKIGDREWKGKKKDKNGREEEAKDKEEKEWEDM